MAHTQNHRHPLSSRRRHLTPQEKSERKQRVLTQGAPSVVRTIANAAVMKEEDIFFLAEPSGLVPLGGNHGYGLYYHDCRYLNGYELTIADSYFDQLVADAELGHAAVFQLTNPDIRMANGRLLPKQQIGVRWERVINSRELSLQESISINNYGLTPVEFPLQFSFAAQFDPLFAVRGLLIERPGQLHPPEWHGRTLYFRYDGADGILRSLSIHFSHEAHSTQETSASFQVRIPPSKTYTLATVLKIAESRQAKKITPATALPHDLSVVRQKTESAKQGWRGGQTLMSSNSILLDRVIDRSMLDLRMLRMNLNDDSFFAAGVPWFTTLFGRDSLITSIQTLAFDTGIAETTLRILAELQADHVDKWRDEEPGKILHEYRVGELARINEIPYHPPYYGTVDATPLFLILIGEHARWAGNLKLFQALEGNVERALAWISNYGDPSGNGYVEYHSTSAKGLINQGWKDSGDAIVNEDGSLADPPIALVEVQGYVYRAKLLIADLYERAGDAGRASQLRHEAEALKLRFNRDFWLEDRSFLALALQADGRPASVISSNPGQALWTGIVDKDKASSVKDHLVADDMFNGWGVRTLSEHEVRYNPVGYHRGTVWPHDNSIIAAGMRRYGFDLDAQRLADAIIEAGASFPYYRLPEVFAGYSRKEYGVPVHYPVACHPQAWAAGAIPFMLAALLGLEPMGFDRRLRIVRPFLPSFVDDLELSNLKVAGHPVDIHFYRTPSGEIAVRVLQNTEGVDVVIESDGAQDPGN